MVDDTALPAATRVSPPVRRRVHVANALFVRRTWAEFGYALIALPLGILGFVFTLTTFVLSVGLLITFIGLPLLALTGIATRFLAGGARQQANALLDAGVAAPPGPASRPGLFGFIRAHLTDPAAWRARLYLVLKLPASILSFTVGAVFFLYGVGGITYWIWQRYLPCNEPSRPVCHRGIQFGSRYPMDTGGRIALVAAAGAVLLLVGPWALHAAVSMDKALVRALLGPTRAQQRVVELERTRAIAVDDSAATLRRIERDLHDGTQARLVALAMNLGLAREKLAEGADPEDVRRILDSAHSTAKTAIVELRDLARGIHPPVLDLGLDAALATLCAHSAVPVSLGTQLDRRPSTAVETIAYFCAAELITNVAKHSGAGRAELVVRTDPQALRLVIRDDGRGGARVGAGSGLTGLTERLRTVDGALHVTSPPGGPTVVYVDIPLT